MEKNSLEKCLKENDVSRREVLKKAYDLSKLYIGMGLLNLSSGCGPSGEGETTIFERKEAIEKRLSQGDFYLTSGPEKTKEIGENTCIYYSESYWLMQNYADELAEILSRAGTRTTNEWKGLFAAWTNGSIADPELNMLDMGTPNHKYGTRFNFNINRVMIYIQDIGLVEEKINLTTNDMDDIKSLLHKALNEVYMANEGQEYGYNPIDGSQVLQLEWSP